MEALSLLAKFNHFMLQPEMIQGLVAKGFTNHLIQASKGSSTFKVCLLLNSSSLVYFVFVQILSWTVKVHAEFFVLYVILCTLLCFLQVCSLSSWPRHHWWTCCAVSLSWPSPTTASCSLYYAVLMKLIWRLWPRCLTLPEIPSKVTSVDSWGPGTGRKCMGLEVYLVILKEKLSMT